jgi:uncharacterized protein YfeS
MSWSNIYDELTLLEKESAGLPNYSYQLNHFQKYFLEKMYSNATDSLKSFKPDEYEDIINKLCDLQNDLEELVNELTKD